MKRTRESPGLWNIRHRGQPWNSFLNERILEGAFLRGILLSRYSPVSWNKLRRTASSTCRKTWIFSFISFVTGIAPTRPIPSSKYQILTRFLTMQTIVRLLYIYTNDRRATKFRVRIYDSVLERFITGTGNVRWIEKYRRINGIHFKLDGFSLL